MKSAFDFDEQFKEKTPEVLRVVRGTAVAEDLKRLFPVIVNLGGDFKKEKKGGGL